MAKRDKLYTVNKWNKPFFEQERRRKLYLWGGDSANPVYGLKTGQAGLRWGYGDTGGTDYTAPVSNLTKQNSLDRAVTTFNQYSNPSYYQDMARTWVTPVEIQSGGNSSSQRDSQPVNSLKQFDLSGAMDAAKDFTEGITRTSNIPESYTKLKTSLAKYTQPESVLSTSGIVPALNKSVYDGVTASSLASSLTN